MTISLRFLGAAGTVTGSRHLLTVGDRRVLVDCGLFQGFKQLRQRNWAPFPVNPSEIDAVILTHAHIHPNSERPSNDPHDIPKARALVTNLPDRRPLVTAVMETARRSVLHGKRSTEATMPEGGKLKIVVNGYGVIGKRVADAVMCQDDMELAGVADIATDWRAGIVGAKGIPPFGATDAHTQRIRDAGLNVSGELDDLLKASDVVIDCTPKRIAAQNVARYREGGSSSSSTVVKGTMSPAIPSSPRRITPVRSGATARASSRATRRQSCAR